MEILIFLIEKTNIFFSVFESSTLQKHFRECFLLTPPTLSNNEISILLVNAKIGWIFPVKCFPPVKDKC